MTVYVIGEGTRHCRVKVRLPDNKIGNYRGSKSQPSGTAPVSMFIGFISLDK